MVRREEDLVTILDPQSADRAADVAGADRGNRGLCVGLGTQLRGLKRSANQERAAGRKEPRDDEELCNVPSHDLMDLIVKL